MTSAHQQRADDATATATLPEREGSDALPVDAPLRVSDVRLRGTLLRVRSLLKPDDD